MMPEKECVCVFMQVYRNEDSMHTAIKSVLNQTYRNLRFCILVSPETKGTVLEYAEKDSRIEVYNGKIGESNVDYCTRRKNILQAGNDAYFTTIDADDWYDEHYIEELVSFAFVHHTDITACGNHFVDASHKPMGIRKSHDMVWNTQNTGQVLPYMYGYFRTVWGKLIDSRLILEQNIEELPSPDTYGYYGGDTIFMFQLVAISKRIGICEKVLYYYRLSNTGHSSILRPGRLDSDALLFHCVKNVLAQLGPVGESQKRFLYQVYGNAVIDTTTLLLHQDLNESEKSDKLLYVYKNPLTAILLQRERAGQLALPGQDPVIFSEKLRKLIFHNIKVHGVTKPALQNYLNIFEILCNQWTGMLSTSEFAVLLTKPEQLDAFIEGRYEELFTMLTTRLKKAKPAETESYLLLLRRISKTIILKPVLDERKFVLKYSDLLNKINQRRDEDAFCILRKLLLTDKLPYQAERLIELWMNLAALEENADQFVEGKLYWIEALRQEGKIAEARTCYEELKGLGITGEIMDQLWDLLKQ